MAFYPRLPDELKLEIWEKAITPKHGGVHHFKIGFQLPRQYHQTLIVTPQSSVDDDPSSWVDLWRLSLASRMSWDLVEKSNHANRVLFWQKAPLQNILEAAYKPGLPALKGTVKTPQEELDAVDGVRSHRIPKPTQAFINSDKDIVCFTVIGSDFDLRWLHWGNNRQRFKDVVNVAFSYTKPVGKPKDWISSPFECSCFNFCTGGKVGFCVSAMCRFLRLFQSLRNVYFTIPITANRLHQHAPQRLPRGTKRGRGGQAIKKTGSQLVTEAMDKFKDTAEEEGLSIFQDRKTTYYEIDDSGLSMIKDDWASKVKLENLQEIWSENPNDDLTPFPPEQDVPGVQFKFLVY